jgi:hypothetical protein
MSPYREPGVLPRVAGRRWSRRHLRSAITVIASVVIFAAVLTGALLVVQIHDTTMSPTGAARETTAHAARGSHAR